MIRLLTVGKTKDKALKELIDEYTKRINGYTSFKIDEVKDEAIVANNSSEAIKDKEGERLLATIKDDEYVIILDLAGEEMDSIAFSLKLQHAIDHYPKITFVIGGSLGLSKEVIKRANYRWKLSSLTFLHTMTRLLVCEQIYRAMKINHHETYHK